jgi:hypothetical protein
MITPIHRIPLDEYTEMQLINSETRETPFSEPGDALTVLIDHTGDQNHISLTLDWAMQLREKTGQDWGTCIEVAMTLYFG